MSNITDFAKSSPGILLGVAASASGVAGLTISSNGIAANGWVLVATGSNSAIWRDAISFGSNTNDVSSVGTMGASASNSRADHVHRGVGSISHSSNTFYGGVTLSAGANVSITSPSDGNLQIASSGAGGGGGDNPVTWTAGTSMPGAPATNERITRTDLGMDFFYDGSRWLSVQLFTEHATYYGSSISASGTIIGRAAAWGNDFDLWLVDLLGAVYVSTTNNGSNYWTVNLKNAIDNNVEGTFNTSGDSADTMAEHVAAIDAAYTGEGFYFDVVKTGSPGTISPYVQFTYRLIGT